jgi:hypothetical protein
MNGAYLRECATMLQNTTQTLNNCGSSRSGAKEARKNMLRRSRGETRVSSPPGAWIDSCKDEARASYASATKSRLAGKMMVDQTDGNAGRGADAAHRGAIMSVALQALAGLLRSGLRGARRVPRAEISAHASWSFA